ncbi:hypothetical protein [Janthinobacterium psychrotolerans]|uniref:Uncharacterized protein n=1 Tax=Janthinobacterium psychrotolerans TaxID=1747903 RepID=A0A1A7C9X9_9BURK|nr:hypothetical protein [Janthinobacterium psychrotolerans]OBV41118.1 hypothetical protein ASR47_102438 [Janthinobacterium psychrotolerans]
MRRMIAASVARRIALKKMAASAGEAVVKARRTEPGPACQASLSQAVKPPPSTR